jgi:hypothetical protein
VDYVATRDAGKPAAARGIYGVIEDGGMDLPGPGKPDPAVHLRRILVHSPANATGEAKRCPETDVMRAYTRPRSPGLIRTESAIRYWAIERSAHARRLPPVRGQRASIGFT